MYCERTGADFWAEPVNALTNLSFLIAALAGWRLARRSDALTPGPVLLVATMLAIGLGSFLFHTFATRWALWMDVVPIAVFQLLFLGLYVRRVMGAPVVVALGAVIAFLAFSYGARLVFAGMHISLGYVPVLIVLAGIGLWHAMACTRGRFDLLAAAGVFAVSLTFRTLDGAVCAALPLGTHFLWHLLNGVVLYLALRALVRQPSPLRAG